MNENERAEQVQPSGFRATVWPHVVDLEQQTSTDDEPMIVAQGDLRVTAEALGSMRILAGMLEDGPHAPIAKQLGEMAAFWQRHVKTIAGIAAVMVLSVVGVIMPTGAPAAQAATVAAAASVPATEAPEPDPVPKDATKFGRGVWLDQCSGDILVAAPLFELFPAFGWAPTPNLPVQVQRYSVKRGRWMVVKTMLTNRKGIAAAVVHIGGGIQTVRVVAPETPWTFRATGTTRRVVVTTEPCDVI